MKIADITFGMHRNKAAQNPAGAAAAGQPAMVPSGLSAVGNAMPCASSSPGLPGRWASFEALFCSVAEENPGNPALSGGGKSLSFRDCLLYTSRCV